MHRMMCRVADAEGREAHGTEDAGDIDDLIFGEEPYFVSER